MPRKKKITDEEIKLVEESFAKGAQLPEQPKESELCGHINKQFINDKGVREDLACTLPKGHEGDHFAKFKHIVTDYGTDENNRIIVSGSHIEESDGWWSDAAGFLPQSVAITPEEDFLRLKAARARERAKGGMEMDEKIGSKVDGEVIKVFNG